MGDEASRGRVEDLQARLRAVGRSIADGFAERARELRAAGDRLDAGAPDARDAIRRLAHKLRGVASTAGHDELTAFAARLEGSASGAASDFAIAEGARRLAAAVERAAAQGAAGEADVMAPAAAAGLARPALSRGLELGWRVVALDDEPSTRRLLTITLEQAGGCDAHVTGDPAEAMALVTERAPAVVLVDAMMPDVDGLSFYLALRRRVGPLVPVVILSAATAEELGWELPDDPLLCWMRKPFRPGALLAELRAFVGA